MRIQIPLAQKKAIVAAHEQRRVGPRADEGIVISVCLDHAPRNAHRQRCVSAGAPTKPDIRFAGERGRARVGDDELCALAARLRDVSRLREPRIRGIRAP